MSTIALITGSARKKGNSAAMADAFQRKAESKGNKVYRFDAGLSNVGGCHGCCSCYSKGKACVFDDDFNAFADRILEADTIAFAFPVYWYSIPGQVKNVIDKFFSFVIGNKDTKGKRIMLMCCCEEEDVSVFDGVLFAFRKSCALMNWEFVDPVLVTGVMDAGKILETDGCQRAEALVDKL